jgi:hypothetical protein
MKITLEKEDLAVLLSKAMGYDIGEDDMEVRTDPFEVVIRDVRKSELAKVNPPDPAPAQRPDDPPPDKPFDTTAPAMPDDQAEAAIAGLRGINDSLAASGGGAGPVPPAEEPMFRDPAALGPFESYDPDDFGDG